MTAIPRRRAEYECSDCPWQGRWVETDAGVCPDCGAEVVPMDEAQEQEEPQ